MTRYSDLFGAVKPIIAMVHVGATPGTPLHDEDRGVEGIIADARADLRALQAAGFDAVMFGNEHDRPYELQVDVAATATMAYVIGRLRDEITVPFGVNVLWDPRSTMALAAVTGARFVREIFTGTYASDMGPWNPDAGAALRYGRRLGAGEVVKLYNVSAEFADSLDRRSLPDRARSAVVSSIPDAVLVSGAITGEPAAMSDLEAVKRVLPDDPGAGQHRGQARDRRRCPGRGRRGHRGLGPQVRRRHLVAGRSGPRHGLHGPRARDAG